MTAADFLIYFMEQNGVALIIATPAVLFLIFLPPRKRRD